MTEYSSMPKSVPALVVLTLLLSAVAAPARAQTPTLPPAQTQPPPAPPPPPPPPPGWTGSFGAGLALTQGNSDTSTINVAYDVKRDTGSPFLFRSAGLFIRGESEGELTTNRLAFDGRVDRKLTERTSVFGQVQYLRDEFKRIDYLVSPTAGLSQFLVKNVRTELNVDAGAGVVWEKNEDLELFTPLWPSVVGAQADEAHRLADLLGDDHDVTVLTELVDELPAELEEQADTLREDALALGARLYADSPNAFEARFRAWWAAPEGSGS